MDRITWKQRFTEALTKLCGDPPPDNLVQEWIDHTSEDLQEWVCCNAKIWWVTGIGGIEAAEVMASNPVEGDEDIDYNGRGN